MTEKRTILIVDDEPDIVQSLQDLLRLEFRVLGTTSPSDGLRILDDESVHVVMSDQRMPEMPGVEFLGRCREQSPETVRLLFTGYADLGAVIEAINEGQVYRYVSKPWNPPELETVIRDAVRRWELLDERRELVRDLQATNERLAESNEALVAERELRTAFIKVLGHELRTPLTILLAAIDLAQRAGPDGASVWLGRIDDAGGRLKKLMENLVTALASESFEILLDVAPVDLAELVGTAVDDVRPFIDVRGQTLDVTVSPGAGVMALDGGKLRNMLNHLLTNAIKFTPDGGNLGLLVERRDDRSVILDVIDDGDGIAPPAIERLFEPFFTDFDVSCHSSGSFEYRARGLGLGLTVVKSIVELHGGTIEARSELGAGTRFRIVLPDRQP